MRIFFHRTFSVPHRVPFSQLAPVSILRAAKCMYKEGKSFTLLLYNDNAIFYCYEELFLEFRYGSVTLLCVTR